MCACVALEREREFERSRRSMSCKKPDDLTPFRARRSNEPFQVSCVAEELFPR